MTEVLLHRLEQAHGRKATCVIGVIVSVFVALLACTAFFTRAEVLVRPLVSFSVDNALSSIFEGTDAVTIHFCLTGACM